MKRLSLIVVVALACGLTILFVHRSRSHARRVLAGVANSEAQISPASSSKPGQINPLASTERKPVIVPRAVAETPLDAVADFSDWAEQFLSGNSSSDLARGEALAWKRRELMLELIENDPERAIKLAVPYEWRATLPWVKDRHLAHP